MQPTVNQRVKIIRKALRMSQQEFAESLGVKDIDQTKISRIESGATQKIDSLLLMQLCKVHSISEHWLKTGEGEMLISNPADTEDGSVADSIAGKIPFSAEQLHKMWLDEMKDRRAEREDNRKLSDALIDLAKSQAEYMKSLANFVAEQTKILSGQSAKPPKPAKVTV